MGEYAAGEAGQQRGTCPPWELVCGRRLGTSLAPYTAGRGHHPHKMEL